MTVSPDGIQLVNESRAQALCAVTRPGWKSWAKSGLIEEDPGGVYDERQVLGVVIASSVRERLSPRDARTACQSLRQDGRWEDLLTAAQRLDSEDRFDLVIEPRFCAVTLARDDAELVRAVRDPGDPRVVLVIALADRLRRVRDGFRKVAEVRVRPRTRKAGRPPARMADVVPIERRPA